MVSLQAARLCMRILTVVGLNPKAQWKAALYEGRFMSIDVKGSLPDNSATKTYQTAQVAALTGIHPNTVRLYEACGLIPKPIRAQNGYRVFTDVHVQQIHLARIALRAQVIQNGLRKRAIHIIKLSAAGEYDGAIEQCHEYLSCVKVEQRTAEEALEITQGLLLGKQTTNQKASLTRKQTADLLGITIDTLRNWEMNGLLTAKRRENGYRVYDWDDINTLKIIRTLRSAQYSLSSILRMLTAFHNRSGVDLREILDTPQETEDIIWVCDRLITSLSNLEEDIHQILKQLQILKNL